VPYPAGMTFALRLPTWLLLCLAAPLIGPGPKAAQLNFDLYAIGVPVGESVMTVDLTASSYRMGLRYRTIGLARMVSNDSLDQTSAGAFEKDLPVPLEYKSVGKLRGHDRTVVMSYRNRTPIPTLIDPPNEGERDIVPEAQWQGTIDPLSAMAEMLRTAARTGRCDVSHRTYDGRRLEAFEARTAGEEDIPGRGDPAFPAGDFVATTHASRSRASALALAARKTRGPGMVPSGLPRWRPAARRCRFAA
jgi:hypothetical protein